jgi:hypothetical protein
VVLTQAGNGINLFQAMLSRCEDAVGDMHFQAVGDKQPLILTASWVYVSYNVLNPKKKNKIVAA